jgi:hypothetical protein
VLHHIERCDGFPLGVISVCKRDNHFCIWQGVGDDDTKDVGVRRQAAGEQQTEAEWKYTVARWAWEWDMVCEGERWEIAIMSHKQMRLSKRQGMS